MVYANGSRDSREHVIAMAVFTCTMSQALEASLIAQVACSISLSCAYPSSLSGHCEFANSQRVVTSMVDSPFAYTVTSTPSAFNPRARSAINNSVPPYSFGGTGIKGDATKAIRI